MTASHLEKFTVLRMSPLIKWKILGHSLRVLVTINTFFQLLTFWNLWYAWLASVVITKARHYLSLFSYAEFSWLFLFFISMSYNTLKDKKQRGSLRTFPLCLPGNLQPFSSDSTEVHKTSLKGASTKRVLGLQFLKTTLYQRMHLFRVTCKLHLSTSPTWWHISIYLLGKGSCQHPA